MPRARYCSAENAVLGQSTQVFTFDVPSSDFVQDLDVEITVSGTAQYSYTLEAGGEQVSLFRNLSSSSVGTQATWYIDDEAVSGSSGASGSQFFQRRPEAPLATVQGDRLRSFDGLHLDDGRWTLTVEPSFDGTPSSLDEWCLSVVESGEPGAGLFADDFESGGFGAWTEVVGD